MSVLEMRNVTRSFRMGPTMLHVLTGVNLEVAPGEWVAIIGTSGSGKSTLLNITGLLDRPDGGTYVLDGIDVATLDDRQRAFARNRLIGFVFQRFNLLPRTPAIEDVATPALYAKVPRRQRAAMAYQALQAVGMEHRADHEPTELSGGEMQRVAIARALVMNPAVVLADEPTGNLDKASGDEVMRVFHQLHDQGRTIVMITHDPSIAAQADRQLRLLDGKLQPLVEVG